MNLKRDSLPWKHVLLHLFQLHWRRGCIFFSPSFTRASLSYKNCMYLLCAMWWFDTHCEMNTTIKSTSITTLTILCLHVCGKEFKIHSQQISSIHTLLVTKVITLCMVPRTYSFYNWKFVSFDHIVPLLHPGSCCFTFCFYAFNYFLRSHI
jgi:hypothetical protein